MNEMREREAGGPSPSPRLDRYQGLHRATTQGTYGDPGEARSAATPKPTHSRRVQSLVVFRSELAHAQRVDVVQNKLDTRNLSTSRRLVRRTDNLRSLFLRVITHHTHAHTPRRFCGSSGTMSSITSPQTCFVGPPPKTRPWPRARA